MSHIQRLSPKEAFLQIERVSLTGEAVLIDVRDPVEFSFVGYPINAVNIPWKFFTLNGVQPNEHFFTQVLKLIPDFRTPLFLICRSGQRSLEAANALEAAGYTTLTNIEEGFEGPLDHYGHRSTLGGWRFYGLPWQQG